MRNTKEWPDNQCMDLCPSDIKLNNIGTFLVTLTGGYTINVDSVTNDAITISGNFPALGGKATFSFSDTNNFRASGWTISYYPEIKVSFRSN